VAGAPAVHAWQDGGCVSVRHLLVSDVLQCVLFGQAMGGALSQRWLQQLGAQAGWRLLVLRRHSYCALGCGDGTGPGLPAGVHLCDQQRQGNRSTSGSRMSGEQENAWCMQVHVQPQELQSRSILMI